MARFFLAIAGLMFLWAFGPFLIAMTYMFFRYHV